MSRATPKRLVLTSGILLGIVGCLLVFLLPQLLLPFQTESTVQSSRVFSKYSGIQIDSESRLFHVHTVPVHRRRVRRSAAFAPKGVRGIAVACGDACRLQLRATGDGKRHKVHLHRAWRKQHHRDVHFVPVVQFVESDDEMSARGGRVPLECMYEARVEGVKEHSLLNLCEDDNGVVGLLSLPDGHVYSIEPVHGEEEENGEETKKKRSHVIHPHHDAPTRLVYDYIGDPPGTDDSLPPKDYLNLTENPWEDIKYRKERSRRAVNSWDYHVEVLVVADAEMYAYHAENLENYLLTLFSTVASIYRHHTLRASVNIVVVKIMILKRPEQLRVTSNAQETLRSFCRWQRMYNGHHGEPFTHHDVAILLTRGDICRSPGKCDTLGLAELGTMCDADKSCAIIEDNGLSAAFTIAHELGHIFNVPHDDERKCMQFMPLNKGNFHIMAPTLEYNTHPWSWSPCSSSLLERFLDSNKGQIQCLFDKPQERRYYDALFESDPPGKRYNVDQQCKFVFGQDATICPYMPACRRLWCSINYGNQQGCRTQHMPWADGTPCQRERSRSQEFCHQGDCVSVAASNSKRVDGAWGEWQPYQRCSRTCGGGVQKSVRECDKPSPLNGGKYCTGKRERYRSCATEECPWDTAPFRDVQCADFNNRISETGIYGIQPPVSFVPKYGVADNERCKLYCRVDGSAAFYLLKEKVVDGTPCEQHGDNICIDGTCMRAGCDHALNSTTTRDQCGVCGGDGSTCELKEGRYNERGTFGYNMVLKIPAGSANIDITQNAYHHMKEDDNYLALRSSDGAFLLNGHYQVSVYRMQIPLQDAIIEYSGSDHVLERINATGPIRTDIYVHVLSVGNLYPPDIRYKYMVATGGNSPGRKPHQERISFRWRMDEGKWSDCDKPCQGRQIQQLMCVDHQERRTHDRNCPVQRPTQATRMCNIECTLRWQAEQSSQCSAQCGHGTVRQRVFCAKADTAGRITPLPAAERSFCPGTPPPETRPCYSDCTGRRWAYSEWTECSESCGDKGVKRRTARCMDDGGRVLEDSYCATEAREETERECGRTPCPRWIYGEWTDCSRSCDGGVRMRHAHCVDAADREIPAYFCSSVSVFDKERCNEHLCTQWKFSPWSECSVTCGKGVYTRNATCVDSTGRNLNYERCDVRERIVQKQCEKQACPSWNTSDWSDCSVSCNDGWQSRRVRCLDYKLTVLSDDSCPTPRPATHKQCNQGTCPFWRISSWTACSATCGTGYRTRVVECLHREQTVDNSFCPENQPQTEEQCTVLACTSWNTSDWSSCSTTCGVGSQERTVFCTRDAKMVDDRECDKTTRPRTFKRCERECLSSPNVVIPPARPSVYWATAPWSDCSSTCGEGRHRRLVSCREMGKDVSPTRCSHLERVDSEQKCTLRPCAEWKADEWMPCPVTCGLSAEQTRSIKCVSITNSSIILNDTTCDVDKRPESTRPCLLAPCPSGKEISPGQWRIQPWSKCSVTCGGGSRSRNVSCERTNCIGPRPKMFEACNKQTCPKEEHAWQISTWTPCSVTCGGGEQRRAIWCEHISGKKVEDVECKTPKPMEQRDCVLPSCAPPLVDPSVASIPRRDWSAGHWSAVRHPIHHSTHTSHGYRQTLIPSHDPSLNRVWARLSKMRRRRRRRRK